MKRHKFIFILFYFLIFGLVQPLSAKPQKPKVYIPEIINLSDNEVVPEEILLKHSSVNVAENIVYRLAILNNPLRQPRWTTKPKLYDWNYETDGELQIFVPYKNIVDVINSNRILNQHQTGTASTYYSPIDRAETEDLLAGIKLENKYVSDLNNPIHKIRPKSGVLVIKKAVYMGDVGMDLENSVDVFGDIVFVLKNSLFQRTTITPCDSFSHGGNNSDIKLFVRSALENKLLLENSTNYIEAQIWGEVTLADILEIRVPKKISSENLEILKKANLPIFEYEEQIEYGRKYRAQGRELYSPPANRKIRFVTKECPRFFKRK